MLVVVDIGPKSIIHLLQQLDETYTQLQRVVKLFAVCSLRFVWITFSFVAHKDSPLSCFFAV
jgi:hypothetical protein